MRIIKKDKEKVDVKKFMEEMKATRTNRSYTSLEPRHRHPSEEPERHFPKYALPQPEAYRPPPNPQSYRYGMEQSVRYPAYSPYAPRTITEFPPSQHFTASPPYQAPPMINYSQSFNSQLPYAYVQQQDSGGYDQQHYGCDMIGAGYPQSRGPDNRMSVNPPNMPREHSPAPEQPSKVKQNNNELPPSPPIRQPDTLSKQTSAVEKKKQEEKPIPDAPKKKRNPRKKKANESLVVTVEKEVKEVKEVKEEEEQNTFSISRRFEEILAAERKKIEDKQTQEIQQKALKKVLSLFNKRIEDIMGKYFTVPIIQKLTSFSHDLPSLTELEGNDDRFEQEMASFEVDMMRKIESLGVK